MTASYLLPRKMQYLFTKSKRYQVRLKWLTSEWPIGDTFISNHQGSDNVKLKFPNGAIVEIRDEFKKLAERYGAKPVKEDKKTEKKGKK